MKNKIILIALLFGIFTTGFGQDSTFRKGYLRVRSQGNAYTRLAADSVMHIPMKASLSLNDIDLSPQVFVYDSVLYYTVGNTYKVASSGAGSSFSGNYNDLTNKPTAFSGSYTDLSNKPTIFSGSYTDLANRPSLFSGSYTDLANRPTLFSGSYSDLVNKPIQNNGSVDFNKLNQLGIITTGMVDQFTGESINTVMVTTLNGVTLTDADVDYIMIFKPNGQYLKRVTNFINPEWWGAKGDGTTDNIGALQNAINFGSRFNIPIHISSKTFLTSALQMKSNVTIIGVDSTSRLLLSPYSSSRSLFPENGNSFNNVSLTNLTLDGGATYTNHFIDVNSANKDTTTELFYIVNYNNILFNNVTFNGAEEGVTVYNTNNLAMLNCKFTNIGHTPIASFPNATYVTVDNTKFLTFGMRDIYDFSQHVPRSGADAIEGAGNNWKISNNYFFNGANTHWAVTESHFTSDVVWDSNIFDANGWNCMSISSGGPSNGVCYRQAFTNNKWINVGSASLRSSDSLNGVAKYIFPNFNEITDQYDFKFNNNTVSNCGMGFGHVIRGSFDNNIVYNSVNETNSSFFRFYFDDENCTVSGNTVYIDSMRSAFLFQGTTKSCTISNNMINDVDGSRFFIEMYGVDSSSTFSGNTISGAVNSFIYSPYNLNMHNTVFTNNNLSNSSISRTNAIQGSDGGYIKFLGNAFSDGRVVSDVVKTDSLTLTASSDTLQVLKTPSGGLIFVPRTVAGSGSYVPPTSYTFTSTGSPTITLPYAYVSGSVSVYENGILQTTPFTQTSSTVITLGYTPFSGTTFNITYTKQ